MYTVMVTGGIGSGKSKLVELLCDRGAVSIDLDEINRALISGNAMLISELAARFGGDSRRGRRRHPRTAGSRGLRERAGDA